jgi:DNA recombination protein RmuC
MLLNDVRLLSDRVTKLQTHFTQSNTDIQQILISTGKIAGRAEKIEKVEFAPEEERTLL